MSFPNNFGDFRGKTFDQIFQTDPKNTEFIYQCWSRDGCTGIFLELYDYICNRMSTPAECVSHIERCKEYCTQHPNKLPNYMNQYK